MNDGCYAVTQILVLLRRRTFLNSACIGRHDAELRLVGALRHIPPGVEEEGEAGMETGGKSTKKRAVVIWKEHPAAAEESHSHGSHKLVCQPNPKPSRAFPTSTVYCSCLLPMTACFVSCSFLLPRFFPPSLSPLPFRHHPSISLQVVDDWGR